MRRILASAAVAAALLIVPAAAKAQSPGTLSGNPVIVNTDGVGALQIHPTEGSDGVFWPSDSDPGRAGLEIVEGGTYYELGDYSTRTNVTPPAQGGVSGAHTLTSVYKIGPDLEVTETLAYTDGAREVVVGYAIKNVSGAAVTFRAAELADLDPGNDAGRSFFLDRDGSHVIGGWTPSGALVGLDENTGWARHQAGRYGDVFEAFATSGLRDTVDPILEDNGVGAEWDVSGLGPGATAPLTVTWRLAADETVNTAADNGNSGCTADPGGCTLREALGTASGGGDIVTVPEDDYALPGGQLTIDHDLTVLGGGARGTRIIGHRDSPSSGDRMIEITNGATLDLRAVTLTNGQAGDGDGGAIRALGDSTLRLADSAITGNEAWDGGGIDSAGTVSIERSTISGNHAWNNGGGLSLTGTASLQNATISGNTASSGGGVLAGANIVLDNVTIADNTANPDLGGGLFEQVDTQTTSATNTLWARNTGGSCRGIQAVLSNYGLADDAQCFTRGGPGNIVSPAVALGPLADNDGDTLTHLPDAGSDAIDHGNPEACPATDQRGFPRPDGPFCDIGAVEGEGSPTQPTQARATLRVVTTVRNDNGGTRRPGDFTVRVRSGGADVSGSPKAGSASGTVYSLAAGSYAVSAAAPAGYATAIGGACAASGTVTLAAGASATCTVTGDDPIPKAHKSVNVAPAKGTVLVQVPGSKKFVALQAGQQVPLGTIIDTRKGTVTLVAAANGSGGTATANFFDGLFKVGQTKAKTPITTLTLVEKLTGCKAKGKASIAKKKVKKRRLWGDGKGRFSTKGKRSAATVVGTKWLVEDTCTTTTTQVARGIVSVRDFVKKKTVKVKAGHKYVARDKR